MEHLLVGMIVLAAAFIQSLSGFGSALVAMPLLLPMLGPEGAAPLMALVSGALQVVLLARYRQSLSLGAVWRLALASVLAIPLGVFLARLVPERLVFGLLAAVLVGYALYALLGLGMPAVRHPGWAFAAGAAAGLLGGAYNTDGPPVIVYGSCRQWPPQEFKSNLQGFFMVNNAVILASHAVAGNLSLGAPVWGNFLAALPALAVGAAAGLSLDRFVNAGLFRKIMLGLLVALGLRLGCRALWGV
jgi:uncharacterized membrane protein YfcA